MHTLSNSIATSFRIPLSIYTISNIFLNRKHRFVRSSLLYSHNKLGLSANFPSRAESKPISCRVYREGTAAASTMTFPIVNGMLAQNTTQLHGALARRNTSFSTATPFPFPTKSQWSPGDISTLVFGCIASVLGVLTLWATFWLGRRRALRVVGNGMYFDGKRDELTNHIADRRMP